ncbi:MAG: hypothetical protein R3264_01330 [Anaerolineae bacterium]|nr:hypothetical protein [Anaerolineae bacterium]
MKPAKDKQPPLTLWKMIVLLIVLAFVLVTLFAMMVYLFTNSFQQMGFPPIVNLVIFVIISGIFAWLLKRLTDIVSNLSHLWFPEETDDPTDTL